jgi:Fic family protein
MDAPSLAIARYTAPHQFEPLLPRHKREHLREISGGVIAAALRLTASAHPDSIALLRELVREMNSYYSNRIEGQSTHPRLIGRAMRRDFSDRPEIARLQRLAVAHVEAERELEARLSPALPAANDPPALSSAFLLEAHRALYGRLSETDRTGEHGQVIVPGRLRGVPVAVGRHEPPPSDALPAFLARFDEVYGKTPLLEDLLLTVAAAHQRMAWIHPFADGNGRACRLQTHCALWPLSGGLWSVSRGLARQRDAYYRGLDAADAPRQGDLDGRGNLSERVNDRALSEWCAWFIALCAEQVAFMTRLFNLDGMKTRIHALIGFRAAHDRRVRMEAALPLYHLFLAGPTPRGEFCQMTGLGERTARGLLSRLIETGLATSASHVAPVRFAFPLDALQFLLPELYPEAATPED